MKIAFFLVLLATVSLSHAADGFDMDRLSASNKALSKLLFQRFRDGHLLRSGGLWHDPHPPRSGVAALVNNQAVYLADVSFSAKAICNLGIEGLDDSLQQLEGQSQTARLIAIYVLHMAFDVENKELLEAQAPMFGVYDGKPRDLSSQEIQSLKTKFKALLSERRAKYLEVQQKYFEAQQAGTGQPATRSQSKSEDSDKPQPEAEGRSR